MSEKHSTMFEFPEVGIPFLWPVELIVGLERTQLEEAKKAIRFIKEAESTAVVRKPPPWATRNKVALSLHTLNLRDFTPRGSLSSPEPYTLIVAPYAGHTSQIADFHKGQSLVEVFLGHGVERVAVTDWKSATLETASYDIDNYLAEFHVCVEELGGVVNLVGLCQGGWFSAIYAARYPDRVASLVLAGAPIDTSAGESRVSEYARTLPLGFFEELVAMGGGVLKGEYVLQGFKSLHPAEQYVEKYVKLYENIDDPHFVRRFKRFERWYEYTIDLPGRWYLQVVKELFKENRFYRGRFIALGRRVSLRAIECPVYLLAGERDDITPPEQVFNAARRLGTPKEDVVKDLAPGGHIGLFMGSTPLRENWPRIVEWQRNLSRR